MPVYYLRRGRIIPLFISIILEHLWFLGLELPGDVCRGKRLSVPAVNHLV